MVLPGPEEARGLVVWWCLATELLVQCFLDPTGSTALSILCSLESKRKPDKSLRPGYGYIVHFNPKGAKGLVVQWYLVHLK